MIDYKQLIEIIKKAGYEPYGCEQDYSEGKRVVCVNVNDLDPAEFVIDMAVALCDIFDEQGRVYEFATALKSLRSLVVHHLYFGDAKHGICIYFSMYEWIGD